MLDLAIGFGDACSSAGMGIYKMRMLVLTFSFSGSGNDIIYRLTGDAVVSNVAAAANNTYTR